jgi:hypothetical protein
VYFLLLLWRGDFETSFVTSVSVPNDPRKVIVQTLVIMIQGRPPIELDLTGRLIFSIFN